MTRNRASAKAAGTTFERHVAEYLADALDDDRIERRAKSGAKDRGDIGGVRLPTGGRLVVECKNTARLNLAGWAGEAEVERGNDDAMAAVIVHKRHGVGVTRMGDQWVTLTLADLAVLLGGTRTN
ncbi:hypothetical protein ACXR2T_10780 [Leucobacter sp. HY1910]